jgi:hypothetical protein
MSTSLTKSIKPSLHVKTPQLPLRTLGLTYVPAVPVDIGGMVDTCPPDSPLLSPN